MHSLHSPARRALALAALAASLILPACRKESKAREHLEMYGDLFLVCKDTTEQAGMKPGEHRCAVEASAFLEVVPREHKLDQATWTRMRDVWLAENGYAAYYVPPQGQRAAFAARGAR